MAVHQTTYQRGNLQHSASCLQSCYCETEWGVIRSASCDGENNHFLYWYSLQHGTWHDGNVTLAAGVQDSRHACRYRQQCAMTTFGTVEVRPHTFCASLAKQVRLATISLAICACLSVRPHETFRLPLDGVCWVLNIRYIYQNLYLKFTFSYNQGLTCMCVWLPCNGGGLCSLWDTAWYRANSTLYKHRNRTRPSEITA
jgi:hypothetical protein